MLVFEVDVHRALDWQCEQGKIINFVDLNIKSLSEFKESNQICICVWQISGEMKSDFGGGVEVGQVGPKKDSVLKKGCFYWFERSISEQ